VLVCDGTGWHQPGKRLRIPDNIALLPLPLYSPELNPMENIWYYLRDNMRGNRRCPQGQANPLNGEVATGAAKSSIDREPQRWRPRHGCAGRRPAVGSLRRTVGSAPDPGKDLAAQPREAEGPQPSALAAWQRIVLGQQATEEKSNEITAIPLLLKHLDLKGALVTMDAMGTQTDIARAIRDGGGDYCMLLKKNCPAVHAEVQQLFTDPPDDVAFGTTETTDLTAGRIEARRHTVYHEVDWMTSDAHLPIFPDLAMIGLIETGVERRGKIEHETRYYLCSTALCALTFARAVRAHGVRRTWRSCATQPQSAFTGQTNHQSEEPTQTRGLERRLSGNHHPTDRMTFKRCRCLQGGLEFSRCRARTHKLRRSSILSIGQ
jgi:Transposase DDE domain